MDVDLLAGIPLYKPVSADGILPQTGGEVCTSVVAVHLGKLHSYWSEFCDNPTGEQHPAALSKRREANTAKTKKTLSLNFHIFSIIPYYPYCSHSPPQRGNEGILRNVKRDNTVFLCNIHSESQLKLIPGLNREIIKLWKNVSLFATKFLKQLRKNMLDSYSHWNCEYEQHGEEK